MGYISVCPILQLSHSRCCGCAVLEVGGPESVPLYAFPLVGVGMITKLTTKLQESYGMVVAI